MADYELLNKKGIEFWSLKKFKKFGIEAVFFRRNGGCSQGVFHSLNLAYNCGDTKAAVRENRARIMEVLEIASNPLILCHQVHGTGCIHVKSSSSTLLHQNSEIEYKKADAMITQVAGLTLGIKTADCMPVFITDSSGKGIAAIHAGWRGLMDGILVKTITKFQKIGSTRKESLHVALGPCIGPTGFEVSDQVLKRFMQNYPESVRPSGDANHGMVDLKKIAVTQLLDIGILKENIITIPDCTFVESRSYFSYRRENGQTGRMLSVITKKT